MNKMLFVVAAVVVIAIGVLTLRPPNTCAAENDDDAVVGGIMRVDLSPIVTRMEAMQAEVASLKESMAAMQKALEDSRASQILMLDAVSKLSPQRWEYKIVRTLNENAALAVGQDGWEMVAISQQGWVYFKRPLLGGER